MTKKNLSKKEARLLERESNFRNLVLKQIYVEKSNDLPNFGMKPIDYMVYFQERLEYCLITKDACLSTLSVLTRDLTQYIQSQGYETNSVLKGKRGMIR